MSDHTYLYMAEFQDGTQSHFKVGVTSNAPRARMAQLQTGSPYPIECSTVVRLPSWNVALEIEALTHAALAEYRMRGEWFRCDATEIGYAVCKAAYGVRHKLGVKSLSQFEVFWSDNVYPGTAQ